MAFLIEKRQNIITTSLPIDSLDLNHHDITSVIFLPAKSEVSKRKLIF